MIAERVLEAFLIVPCISRDLYATCERILRVIGTSNHSTCAALCQARCINGLSFLAISIEKLFQGTTIGRSLDDFGCSALNSTRDEYVVATTNWMYSILLFIPCFDQDETRTGRSSFPTTFMLTSKCFKALFVEQSFLDQELDGLLRVRSDIADEDARR